MTNDEIIKLKASAIVAKDTGASEGWGAYTIMALIEHIEALAAAQAPSAPTAEDYSDMLREFFCCYAAGGYNDDGGLVPLSTCREKLDWIVEDQRRHAVAVAPSAPVALDTIRDLDHISMQFAADLCKLPVVAASNKRNVDYLARQDVMDLVVSWRAAWSRNSASRLPIDRAALSVKAEKVAILEQAAQACDQQADGTNGPFRSGCLACANAVRELRNSAAAPTPPTTGEA